MLCEIDRLSTGYNISMLYQGGRDRTVALTMEAMKGAEIRILLDDHAYHYKAEIHCLILFVTGHLILS